MTTTREEFRQLAKDFRAIPVHRELVADMVTPVAAFLRCVADEPGFCLESVDSAERWSRFSFIGRRPHASLIARGNEIEVRGSLPDDDLPLNDGILTLVETILSRYTAPVLPDLPPLTSGLVGYIGYDVVREVENLNSAPHDDRGFPDAMLDLIGEMAVFDHWRQRVTLIAVALLEQDADAASIDAAYDDAVSRIDSLAADGARPVAEPLRTPPATGLGEVDEKIVDLGFDIRPSLDDAEYAKAVEVAKEHIRAGDIFQVVLSKRFDVDLRPEPFDVYRQLRQLNPSPYMYFLRQPELTLVGCSPEPLVQVNNRKVTSRPIAGTRPRGATDAEDRRFGAELSEDPKELAEHVMLVDLARNDLGRVVQPGSLEVEEMMTVELYSHVMHLTSQVSGTLRDEVSVIDVLRATIPAGTVSGAPKIRAMEIIDDLEPVKRGPYAGLVGYIDFSGNLDSAITIRTMVCSEDHISVQAGAGIVADSDPASENDECWNKAKALLVALKPAAEG